MGKPVAYGGVLVDELGQILLREPRGHYGGNAWTFPMGHPCHDESPEQAALREVKEETGFRAEIVARIPGVFEGDTTDNVFFLMRSIGEGDGPDE